jgi:ABC-type Fe3+-hydroxamate transport system, periplasmic component
MRVVSLLPSATEILTALDIDPVGVSHSCDYPSSVRELPTLTSTPVDYGPDQSASDIDSQMQSIEGSAYDLDIDTLATLDPDLIITQDTCEVCAVDSTAVHEAVAAHDIDADIMTLHPHSLTDVLADIERVGTAVGVPDLAADYRHQLTTRVEALSERAARVAAESTRPRTVALDWTDPLIAGGHWVPELIERAGAEPGLISGGSSTPQRWADIEAFAPEVLLVAPCGFELSRAVEAVEAVKSTAGDAWQTLPAVETGVVAAIDGNGYLNRPGPRLVDTLEIIAGLCHPTAFDTPDSSIAQPLSDV